jgi:hypothetical protein
MNKTNQSINDVVNMSSKTNHSKSIAWWGALLLVAPLV